MKIISLRNKHKRVVNYILVLVATLFFSNAAAENEITDYQSCLGSEYHELVTLQKEYDALKNENFQSYELKGWKPADKFKSDSFEQLCKLTDLPPLAWLDKLCKTYDLGQAYNKTINDTVMNGIAIMPNRGVNPIYREYLRTNKEFCEQPGNLKPPPTDYVINLPAEAQKHEGLIALWMVRGWKSYCEKAKAIRTKSREKKDLCVAVPDVRKKSLLDACVQLEFKALKCTHDQLTEFRQDPDKTHWQVYQQKPLPGTLIRRYIRNNVDLNIKKNLSKVQLTPGTEQQLKPGEVKQIKAEAYYQLGSSMDITLNPAIRWQSSSEFIATVKNGLVTINQKAPGNSVAKITATFTHFGITQSAVLPIRVMAKVKLKEIVLEPQNGTYLTTLSETKRIKAFAVFTDGSKQEITKSKEITWKANKPFVNFIEKGKMTIGVVCWKSLEVTADYQHKGTTYQSKQLEYKIDPNYTYVPWVITEKKVKAIKMLKDNQLVPDVEVNTVFDKNYSPNEVIFQDPLYCVIAKKGSKVLLKINPDPSDIKIKVPNLLGKNLKDASSIVQQMGLNLQAKFPNTFNTHFKPKVIFSQNPKKGTPVQLGTFINVKINPEPKKVKVPNLICMMEKQAKSVLSPLKLILSTDMASSYDTQCKKGEIIEQNPQKGDSVLEGSEVKVLLNPSSKPLMGIDIQPEEKRSYPLNTKLTFIEYVTLKSKGNTYHFKWYLDNREVSKQTKFSRTFNEPGTYRVTLDLISSDPTENDTISTTISIDYPEHKETECNIIFEPSSVGFKVGAPITFIQDCKNTQNVTEYIWYVDDREIASGKRITHTFDDQGAYKVKLGLKKGSNYDAFSHTKSITIGLNIGLIGDQNKFEDNGNMSDLRICSRYWQGGRTPAAWSRNCTNFSDIGAVDGYGLCTGDQSGGWNSGFLVYAKKGSTKLKFEVYGFDFNRLKGVVTYDGLIPKSDNVAPGSIAVSCHQNAVDVSWSSELGSQCETRIWRWKFRKYSKNYGVKKPSCSKPDIDSNTLKRCKKFAEKAVEQYEEGLKKKNCNMVGDEWHGDLERHKQWCVKVSKKKARDLTEHRDNVLENCGKTWCDAYARRSVAQNEENIRNHCNFGPNRSWQSNFNNHYNWCRKGNEGKVSKRTTDRAIRERDQKLQQCTSWRKGSCKKYAETAVAQNDQNMQKDCGFCGPRWQSNYENHYQWCLAQKQPERDAETKSRAKLLRQCQGVSKSGKRTFFESCYNNYRLDNCLNYAVNSTCKKPAADKFCESKGYKEASQFTLEKVRPTFTMGDNRICDADFCAGFSKISCIGYKYPDNTAPVCRIKSPLSSLTVKPGKYVHFKADASDTDKDRLNYTWLFEGGRPDKKSSSMTSNATAQWRKPGIYTTTLMVSDGKGGSCTDTLAITVQEEGSAFDCDSYASKSVSQNEENLRKNCGLSGILWHSSKNKHLNWCSSGKQSIAPRVIAERERALKECREPVIISTGVLNCEIIKPSKLAFTNAGVPVDFAGSAQGNKPVYSWKFDGYQTKPASSNKKNPGKVTFKWPGSYKAVLTVTDATGKSCQASRDILVHDSKEPREFCESYASISVGQNDENTKNNCGLSGSHWHSDEFNHQKWCQSASVQQAKDGLSRRDEALRKCSGKPVVVEPPPQQTFNLAGDWVGNGHKVKITQSGKNVTATALENKGPVGWKIAVGTMKNNTVHMNFNGQKLTGNISSNGYSIAWSNGATWTQVNLTTKTGGIRIESATYGKNCGTAKGNVTSHIAKACNGKSECKYTVDHRIIGDPAYGCAKTYTVQYRCGDNSKVFEETLSEEAGWGDKSVVLDCGKNQGGITTDPVIKGYNCAEYADQSVNQNEENLREKCGFSGELWHSVKSVHTNWCLNSGQEKARQNIAIREKALSECKHPNFGTSKFNEFSLKGNIYYLPTNTSRLPDFGAMSPVGSIYTKELNISNRSFTTGFPGVTKRFEWFGIRYIGVFKVQQGGHYKFRLVSDDGSKLLINNELIINNDGVHPFRSKSGSIYLKPGQHHIQVDFFQGPRTMLGLQLFVTEPGGTEKIFSPEYSSNQITAKPVDQPITSTDPVGFTLDFETGKTNGWIKTGTAFEHQPTYGDNPTARHRGQPSRHAGKYWIGTYEKYQGHGSEKPGHVQGDGPKGTLISKVFTIPPGSLSFLVGGGSSSQTRVELLVEGKSVLQVSGKNTETMHRVKWDINQWAGKQGQIRLVDNASGGWGHINADDFRFSGSIPSHSGPVSKSVTYLGCYKDQGDRDLSGHVFNDSKMTTDRCTSECRSRGFTYAGTQYSKWCFCGNSYGNSGPANNCNMPCSGISSETCGGSWANSVYQLKSVGTDNGKTVIDGKGTFSCKNKDNEEKGCCCFKGTHTYLFESSQVKNIHARFDTGKRFNCKSTVKLDIKQNDTWKTIKQVQANSSSNGKELNPIDVVVPVNAVIKGFRISDGCVCCIDDSSIRIDGQIVPGLVQPKPIMPDPVKPEPTIINFPGKTVLSPVADSHVYAYSYQNWNTSNWGKYDLLAAGWHPTGGEKRT